MDADLKSLRSTMELMAEQVGKLVAHGSQQIEAIERLAPLITRSAEEISGSVREDVTAVQTLSPPSAVPPVQEPVSAGGVHNEQQQDVSSEPEPVRPPEALLKRIRRSAKTAGPAHKVASSQVVVKSIPDAKRLDRFYTTIRLPGSFGTEQALALRIAFRSTGRRRLCPSLVPWMAA